MSNELEIKGILDPEDIRRITAYNAFIIFMSLPDPDKAVMMEVPFNELTKKYAYIPKQKDFAVKYGVHENTLTQWKKRKDFISSVDIKRKEWGLDKVPNVLAALYTRCIKYGMAYDVETYLAYYANWNRTQVIKNVTDKFDVDDLRSIIQELPESKQKDAYTTLADIITQAELRRGEQESEGFAVSGSGDNQGEVRS